MNLCTLQVSKEELENRLKEARAIAAADPKKIYAVWTPQYKQSMFIRQDNTLQKAKDVGVLDAQELYPNAPRKTLREYAEAFYNNPGILPYSTVNPFA